MNFEIAPKSTEINVNWDDARLYCMFLEIDSKTGWRLPTREELNEIYQSKNDFVGYYWSSTEYRGSYAWFQRFGNGDQYYDGKNVGGYYVRAVRSLS